MVLVGHLLTMFRIREKRILGMAVGKHRVFPVTRHGYSSSAMEVARVPLKKRRTRGANHLRCRMQFRTAS
jgi:hypothetical protein